MIENTCIACSQCDLLIKLRPPEAGNRALCPRCDNLLTANHPNAINRVIVFSFTALLFLFLSNIFPFLSIYAQGLEQSVTLLQSILILVNQDFITLAILIFITVILIPGIYLICALYICLSIKSAQLLPSTSILMKLIIHLKQWNMAEIFLIGILVSFIKIVSLADISLGLSFWAYIMFILSMTLVMLNIDKYQFWQWINTKQNIVMQPLAPIPTPEQIQESAYGSCSVCESFVLSTSESCNCCGAHQHKRINNSVQKTWALIITALLLYVPANVLPIMRMKYLGVESSNTIVGGVIALWQHGSYPIALIIFIASVLVPIGKIIALSWLCYKVQRGNNQFCKQKTILYRGTELIGRWSMIDVFVVVILVALIRAGDVMSVYPGLGAIAFSGLVVVTIMAAISFDPRLIWDNGACR
ncbi:MAG TPA: PqiA/YebS family transporter subunit [Gammaproteobacteria bacterium]|nr:PqiA/YebS family transporter subunit [Gammaproteobacteria bacterium]